MHFNRWALQAATVQSGDLHMCTHEALHTPPHLMPFALHCTQPPWSCTHLVGLAAAPAECKV